MRNVLVDTSVWSLAFRKKEPDDFERKVIARLSKLVLDLDVVMIGPIRQEILSGIQDKGKFDDLRERLSIFHDLAIRMRDYEKAAAFFNECRKRGIQGSHIDFLICAVAHTHGLSIMTLDNDFEQYGKYLDIRLEKLA